MALVTDKMKLHLREGGVTLDSAHFTEDPDHRLCDSFDCNTGWRFQVWTDSQYEPLLLSMGFEQAFEED